MTLLVEALVFPVGWASAQAAAAPAALVAPRRLAVLLAEFVTFAIPSVTGVTTFVTFPFTQIIKIIQKYSNYVKIIE